MRGADTPRFPAGMSKQSTVTTKLDKASDMWNHASPVIRDTIEGNMREAEIQITLRGVAAPSELVVAILSAFCDHKNTTPVLFPLTPCALRLRFAAFTGRSTIVLLSARATPDTLVDWSVHQLLR